jgi:hypothetical protein
VPFFGFDRVMACTRADLARWLTELTGADHGMAADGRAMLPFAWGELAMFADPLPPRRVALLKIQQMRVRFVAPEGREAEAREWLTAFDRHTQRGGG